ncbi:PREDICTED: WRKY transcription factor 44 isoform X2 [Tarenaya hassleriana]|uniref:WRKY transcription factor 44 isoform X2 n=1 Tax=Tarenaya hassleriana TaxID=28532 RepID=UPI00053C9C87|nr:PREDICTED: WRKY transcription factor 44 isoform X2 [Tarenaya hassleriana]
MEMKKAERVVIVKPVASRPSCSGFRTFTELLTKSVTLSPTKRFHETVVSAIKPKTARVSPLFPQPRGEVSSDDQRATESFVVYKPKAKVVSKATISVLAKMLQGKVSVDHRQGPLKQNEVPLQNSSRDGRQCFQKVPTFAEAEANARSSETSTGDRSSLDGYNWRKYGQKQVKGSEFPRSYYKCTHINCPTKKKVESSLDGKMSEVVYQGEHNHPKPRLPPRSSTSSRGSAREDPVGCPPRRNMTGSSVSAASGSAVRTSDSCCRSGDHDGEIEGLYGELDDPKSKRRKNEHRTREAGVSEEGSVDSEALEDGFRWRKYGQKVVGGNPFPRSRPPFMC